MNEEFKARFDKYKNGEMTEEEMVEFEGELEKLETYQMLLDEEMFDDPNEASISPEKQRAILQYGKNKSYLRISVLAIITTLMILPVCTLGSYLYYGLGGNSSKGSEFIHTAAITLSLTEPNLQIDTANIKSRVELFGMKADFPLQRQVGNEQKAAGHEEIALLLNRIKKPNKSFYYQEINDNDRIFIHPSKKEKNAVRNAESILKQLPDGTVSEAFLSFDQAYSTKEIYEKLKKYDIRVIWKAIETEANSQDRPYSRPIGFPGKDSAAITTMTNQGSQSEDQQFESALAYITEHHKWAESIADRKDLNLSERLSYIKQNGVNVYGVVVTGPTREIEHLIQSEPINAAKLGEVELWN
ncbi:anti-sigma factor [Bacillus gobiensis]|uniref:anti-sigma factor n=1 Tax=Bacillus gobiensis TaxID=1441095 RepID=UPI003D1A0203